MIGYVRAYENMIETSASDWFNRLIAIRFMEINEYAPLETRLLSSAEEGKQDPDLYRIPLYQIWIFLIQNIIRLWNGRMRTGRRIKPHIRERTLFLGRIVFSLWQYYTNKTILCQSLAKKFLFPFHFSKIVTNALEKVIINLIYVRKKRTLRG